MLDLLFGAEEEFDYSSTTMPAQAAPDARERSAPRERDDRARRDPRPPSHARALSGEKAQRIVEAMRHSVARRGAAGSTFDHVSREAGVSRGLLHYYFGTKEQLLVEAARRDCELRIEALEQQLAGAQTADDFVALLAENLQETIHEDPDFVTLVFELFTLSRRNEDIAVEYARLVRLHARAPRRDARRRARRGGSAACTPSPRRSPTSSSRSATASRCA